MKLSNVSIEDHRRWILFNEWELLRKALYRFAELNMIPEEAVLDGVPRPYNEPASLPDMLAMGNDFVDQMTEQAWKQLSRGKPWARRYETRSGAFSYVSVYIGTVPTSPVSYYLGLESVDVSTAEAQLAANIGYQQALMTKSVVLEIEPLDGTFFELNFDYLLKRLSKGLDMRRPTTKKFMAEFDLATKNAAGMDPIRLLKNGPVTASLILRNHVKRYLDNGSQYSTFRFDGALMKGMLSSKKPTIEIVFSQPAQPDEKLPFFSPKVIEMADTMAQDVAKAFAS